MEKVNGWITRKLVLNKPTLHYINKLIKTPNIVFEKHGKTSGCFKEKLMLKKLKLHCINK